AKEFADDDRPLESRTVKYFLKPGTYSVGRLAGQCDIAVTDDKSISREHAHLWVPGPEAWESEAQGPFVRVSDTSRYGTLVTPTNEGMLARGKDKEAVARHEFYIKFGLKSPFRLRAWDEHEGVWRHDAPDEAAHPPKLAGSRSVADLNSFLRDLEAQQALKDQAFAWEGKAKDALWAGTDPLGALQVARPPTDVPAAEEHTGDTTEASEDEGTMALGPPKPPKRPRAPTARPSRLALAAAAGHQD
ncbi:hypothetical protein APUTEX25_003395, partial [Auxenochlorella protothecoides]